MAQLQVLPIKATLRVRFVDLISKVRTRLNLESTRIWIPEGGYQMTTPGGPQQW